MNRPRKKDRHLPACVYQKHGAFYYVKAGKWTKIGDTLPAALTEYARLVEPKVEGGMDPLLNRWLGQIEVKPNTYAQYRLAVDRLKVEMSEFTPAQVRPSTVAQLLDHHRATPNMANRMRSVLKLAFDKAVLWGMCDSNPVVTVKPFAERKRDRYVTDAEFAAIREKANEQCRAVMDLCFLTAQRIGDILNIKHADISEEGIAFTQEKTGKRLIIAMTPDLAAVVARAKTMRNVRGFYLVAQRNGKPYSYKGMRDNFARAVKAAKIEDVTLHDLRAKSITDGEKQGLDPQKLAGHNDARTTKIYLRDRQIEVVKGPAFKRAS